MPSRDPRPPRPQRNPDADDQYPPRRRPQPDFDDDDDDDDDFFLEDISPDSTSFDLDLLEIPDDLTTRPEPAPKPQRNIVASVRETLSSPRALSILIPLAVIAGSVALLRIGMVLWQISPYAVAVPLVIGGLFVLRRYYARWKVGRWYNELVDAVAERGLLQDASWVGPAVSLPAPDEIDRPLWNGMLVIYPKGIAWFPTEEATEKKAMWWKKSFADIALVHRTSGSNGVGMDIHLQGGLVKCNQVPPGWSGGAPEALAANYYPVLDD